jgi:HEAT repeat protein
LTPALGDENAEVRRTAIVSLGKLGKGNASVEEAVRKFSDDADPLMRTSSMVALAEMGKIDESEYPQLFKALGGDDKITAGSAGRVLSELAVTKPDELLPLILDFLDKAESRSIGPALPALKKLKGKADSALPKVAALYDAADPKTRLDIIDTLTAMDVEGNYAIPVLTKALKEPDAVDRREALVAMSRYRKKADFFIDALINALKDKDPENRWMALGMIRGAGQAGVKAVPELTALIQDPDYRVRGNAVTTLADFNPPPPEVLGPLGNALKDKDQRMRSLAVSALLRVGKTHPQEVIATFESALTAESYDPVKRRITSALQQLREKPAEKSQPVAETKHGESAEKKKQ